MDPDRRRIARFTALLRAEDELASWAPMLATAEATVDAGTMAAADAVALLDGLSMLWRMSATDQTELDADPVTEAVNPAPLEPAAAHG